MTELNSPNSAASLINRLVAAHTTMGVAESLTGGLVTATLTSVPGASAVIRGGVVAYSAAGKESLLHVSHEAIAQGVVSEAVALQMALGVKKILDVDISVSCTGVAGPGDQDGIRQGTVWIAGASKTYQGAQLFQFEGDREQIRDLTVEHVIDFAHNRLISG
jgi:nicotinamide-nucleotide amidase